MAKVSSTFLTLSGTVGDTVHVNSKAYGAHTRSPRGTYTPATLNSTLQANMERTALLNGIAKPIHDTLKTLAKDFKENMLWQEILKRLRAAKTTDTLLLLQSLKELEINSRYRLSRFAKAGKPLVNSLPGKVAIMQELLLKPAPVTKADSWHCRLVLLVLDADGKPLSAPAESVYKLPATGKHTVCLETSLPPNACYWLTVLELQAYKGEHLPGTRSSMAMQVTGAASRGVVSCEL